MNNDCTCSVSIVLHLKHLNYILIRYNIWEIRYTKMLNWEVNQGLTSTITWPASRVLFAKILLLPTLQSWAIWQDPIIRLLLPITWLCIMLVRIWSSLNVIQNFYFENGGEKKKKKQPQQPHHYRPITWLRRTVDWGMFSDVIVVANIKETFIPWLNDRHIYIRGVSCMKTSTCI